jgi:SAM-dependent methyltransferase
MSDDEIYDHMKAFLDQQPHETKRFIQHQGHYRGVNRSGKIMDFINSHRPGSPITRMLDIGCGDGSITKIVKQKFGLGAHQMFGCDICPIITSDFGFHAIDESCLLPYPDAHFDIVYALMSLHHIRKLDVMLGEIRRVLIPGGLLIVREHDCISNGLSDILDIVHGFYAMVWNSPREHVSFQDEYYGKYQTARDFDILIAQSAGLSRMEGSNRDDEHYPSYHHGKIMNPLKHYWAVYKKEIIIDTSLQSSIGVAVVTPNVTHSSDNDNSNNYAAPDSTKSTTSTESTTITDNDDKKSEV